MIKYTFLILLFITGCVSEVQTKLSTKYPVGSIVETKLGTKFIVTGHFGPKILVKNEIHEYYSVEEFELKQKDYK